MRVKSIFVLMVIMLFMATPAMAAPACKVIAQIAPANQTVPEITAEGAPTVVKLNGEPSKDESTYSWVQTGGPEVTLDDSTAAQPTFTTPNVGPSGASLTFQLTVSGCTPTQTSSITTTINVTNVETNLPPVASATVDPYPYALEEELVTLDGSGSSDPDGDTLTFTWEQLSGTSVTMTLDSSGAIVTFTAPNDAYPSGEALTFRLTVSDGALSNSIDKIVNITWVNDPPIASITCPESANEGVSVTLDGSGSTDSDNGIASYAWNQLEGLPNADLTGVDLSAASITFTAPQLGPTYNTMKFGLTVTDNGGLKDSAECNIVVLDITPPVISGAADITAEASSASGVSVIFNPTATDAVDGDVSVDCSPASGSIFALGTTTVNCSASDTAGNSASASFTVTVQDTTPPVIIGIPGDITAEATGPDGAAVTYTNPTATDLVDGSVPVSCSPAYGSTFPLGTTTVTCTATDANSNTASSSFNVTVKDTTPPTISGVPGDITAEATGPSGASVTYTNPTATDLVDGSVAVNCSPASGSTFPLGTTTVTCSATDAAGNTGSASFTVTVQDTTPPDTSITSSPSDPTNSTDANFTFTGTDIVTPPASLIFKCKIDGGGFSSCTSPQSYNSLSEGSHTFQVKAIDNAGNIDLTPASFTWTVDTTPPIVSDVEATPNPVAAGQQITITATIDDSGTGNSNIKSAGYNIDGFSGSMVAQDGNFDEPTEDVTADIVSLPTGVYNVCVHGTDIADNTGDEVCTFLAVYDPSAGFVTGGGWINSPAGAYSADLSLTGKANFGFVSKYKKGTTVPTGNTEFQFKAGNLNFHSEIYEWLVIAGARAQYKGTGTINGTGNYGFLLTAIDGQVKGGGGVDKFRIKIWDNDGIVYDNKMDSPDTGDDATELGGGSIVIHK